MLHHERVGAGRPIVLLHGLASDRRLWHLVAPRLAQHHEVVLVDLPGHGASGPIPHGADIAWMAGEVARLLDGLHLEDAVLAGLSMGGGIAQVVALDHPRRVGALGLISTSSRFPEATQVRFLERAEAAERGGMAAVVDATVPRWFTARWMAAHADEVDRTRATVLAMDPEQFVRASRLNAVRDVHDRLPAIRVPVLFLAGLDDPADPHRALAEYRAALPGLRVALVPRASHLLPLEAPDAVVRALGALAAAHA